MTVVDTDVLLDTMRGERDAVALVDRLLVGSDPVAVSAVTVLQLHEGIERSRVPPRELERVRAALLGFTTYAFTREIAERAGRIQGELARRGKPLSTSDLMIGVTALHHGEPVATRNLRDFGRIPGLQVVAPGAD